MQQPFSASSLFSSVSPQPQSALTKSSFGAPPTATAASTSIFGPPTGLATGLGKPLTESGAAVPSSSPVTGTTGTKKFLPGRPSLQDVLAVAPQWRETFEKVNKEIVERDEQILQLKSLLRELKIQNEAQKALLKEKLEVAKAHQADQQSIEAEVDSVLPVISKLQRQCTSLSESCERTVAGGTGGRAESRSFSSAPPSSTYQPLTVPQPEYLRFISDFGQRVQTVQDRAAAVARSISLLSDELRKGTSASLPTFTEEIKTTLSLLMAQYRQLKLRQLGLHKELQASIDRYQQMHQLGPDLDRYLEEEEQTAQSSSKGLLPSSQPLRHFHHQLSNEC